MMSNSVCHKLSTGREIPIIGLGVFETEAHKTADLVYKALKTGYRHIDCAMAYKNEKEVCDGIMMWINEDSALNKRDAVFYTTKIGSNDQGYESALRAIQLALDRAKSIGYIDLILIHSPTTDYERRHGTWMALQEAYESGMVKSIGVSNYGIKHLEELLSYPDLKVKPAVNQLEVHPWYSRIKLARYCDLHDIIIEASSPLARGKKADDPVVAKIAKKHDKLPMQVLIKWSVSKGFVCLPKTAKESRLEPNLKVDDFELTKEDMADLDALDYEYVSGWDPTTFPLDHES